MPTTRREKISIPEAVALLCQAADALRATEGPRLLLPDREEGKAPYALGLVPGRYDLREVAEAVQFLADMLEE